MPKAAASQQLGGHHRSTNHRGHNRQHSHQATQGTLQRGSRRTHASNQRADLAVAGTGSGGSDSGQRPAGQHCCAGPRSIILIIIVNRLHGRQRLTGQGGFIHQELSEVNELHIGSDDVAFVQQHHITHHNLFGQNRYKFAVANHRCRRGNQQPQLLKRSLGPRLKYPTNTGDRDQRDKHHDGIGGLTDEQIGGCRHKQQRHHRIREWAKPSFPPTATGGGNQSIGAIGDESLLCLSRAECANPNRNVKCDVVHVMSERNDLRVPNKRVTMGLTSD